MKYKKIVIDLGSGHDKVPGNPDERVIGVDWKKDTGVDLVHNLEKKLPFKKNFADRIYSNHTFEHIENVVQLIEECWRITKSKGEIFIRVPHYTSTGMYTDLTHKTFFSSRSLDYFIPGTYLSTMSGYPKHIRFYALEKKIVCYPPYKIFEGLVNLNDTTRKLYEYLFCWILPANEIIFRLRPIKRND